MVKKIINERFNMTVSSSAMARPTVSIGMPVYNSASRGLRRAIDGC